MESGQDISLIENQREIMGEGYGVEESAKKDKLCHRQIEIFPGSIARASTSFSTRLGLCVPRNQ